MLARRTFLTHGLMVAMSPFVAGCNVNTAPFAKITTNLGLASLDEAALAAVNLKRERVGMLELPDGKVVVSDPLVQPEAPPMVREIPAGKYPVDIIWSNADQRVAAAILTVKSEASVTWELARRSDQDEGPLADDEFYPVLVDAGLAMFASAKFNAAMEARSAEARGVKARQEKRSAAEVDFNYYNDVLSAEMANDTEFLMHYPMPDQRDAGAAIVHSGWGDGRYPAIWGLDARGNPVVLMVDFLVIDDSNGIPREQRSTFQPMETLWNAMRKAAGLPLNPPSQPH